MTSINISNSQARRIAVFKQRLTGPRPPSTADAIVDLIRDLGCVQIDPIRAVERTQHLVLWSRLSGYDPSQLDVALWEERRLFEYWAHAASIVLTENYQIHRSQMEANRVSDRAWEKENRNWMEGQEELRERVIESLRESPPLSAAQLSTPDSTKRRSEPGGWSMGSDVSRLLSTLWTRGELMIAGRNNQTRLWTLPDRWLPDWVPDGDLSEREVARRAVQISLKALGVGTPVHIRNHFVRAHYPGLNEVLAELVSEGQVRPVTVEDDDGTWSGDWFIHADDVPLLERLGEEWEPRTTLLSPFDNLVCDRSRTLVMWDFDFTIEIYLPKAQRRYGYYVMPILHGDRLVGRIDPKMDRSTGTLIVNAVYAEPSAREDVGIAEGTARSIEDLGRFLGARRVKYGRRKPPGWRPYLRTGKLP